jgi:hypothetical protein
MEKFKISTDPTDKKSMIVSCTKRELFIRVIAAPEEDEDPGQRMILGAQLDGILSSIENEVYFEILYRKLDPEHKKWDMKLIYDACEHYCQKELNKEPTGFFFYSPDYNFFPYFDLGEVQF